MQSTARRRPVSDTGPHETFSIDEALNAQEALRQALGKGPESFPMPAFVGMISDEIDQLRQNGKSDDDIAEIIRAATGKAVTGQDLAAFYVEQSKRHPET